MLKVLDRYIIVKFLSTFFYVVLLFTLISCVIDYSVISQKISDEPVTLSQLLGEYYLNFIPWINSILWPIFILISVIFFTSRLAKNSEIISVFNAGVSYRRFLRPYLMVSLFLFLIHLLGNHYVVPLANKSKFKFENTFIYKGNDRGKNRNVHFFLNDSTKAYVRYFNKTSAEGRDVRLETIVDGRVKKVMSISNMKWKKPDSLWTLENYRIHEFNGLQEKMTVINKGSLDTSIAIHPDDFVKFINEKDWLTSAEILEISEEEVQSGRANTMGLITEYYRRTADSFSIIVLTFIGVAVASRKVRGGMGLHLALGISVGALYVFASRFSIIMAVSGNISPVFAVWIPNIIFSCIAAVFIIKAQK